MVGTLKKMTINTQDFWKIMFDELDKTSQKDWEKFVKNMNKNTKRKNLKNERKELISEIISVK